ncbi:MAG TPA: helix-turn-helix transcriptional regulator [Myxococcota bacterium]|nr:helix-turn-helix transcriptional regulator [Myxococcota bacterium]
MIDAYPGASRALTGSEVRVAELLGLGHSEKQIAWALELSPSSVSRRIQSGARKLGMASRVELAAMFAQRESAWPARLSATDGLESLSFAERAVARLATSGRSDAEIAQQRGASARTVQNQLQSVYRKLGVHSRTELAARLFA